MIEKIILIEIILLLITTGAHILSAFTDAQTTYGLNFWDAFCKYFTDPDKRKLTIEIYLIISLLGLIMSILTLG